MIIDYIVTKLPATYLITLIYPYHFNPGFNPIYVIEMRLVNITFSSLQPILFNLVPVAFFLVTRANVKEREFLFYKTV